MVYVNYKYYIRLLRNIDGSKYVVVQDKRVIEIKMTENCQKSTRCGFGSYLKLNRENVI